MYSILFVKEALRWYRHVPFNEFKKLFEASMDDSSKHDQTVEALICDRTTV